MKSLLIKRIALSLIVIQFFAVFTIQMGGVKGEGQRTIKIVDYATGLNYVNLGNESEPLPQGGWSFMVKVLLEGATTDVASWQVTTTFDNNSLECTNILIPGNDPSYLFYGKQQISASDFSEETQSAKYGGVPYVVAAAALIYPDQAATVDTNALLCIMNFTAMKRGNFTLSFIGVDDYSLTFLWDSNGIPLPLTSGQPYTTESFLVSVIGAVSKPIARFTFRPENPRANDTVNFDASKSYDPGGGSIQSYEWAFGDNTTFTNTSSFVNHTYSQNGVYSVNLTIVGADNLTGSTTLQVQVGSIPTANFTYSPLGAILPADEVTFNASESAALNSTIVIYSWDFGDNSTITSNDTIATHSYSVRGVYTVNLTVVDSDGLSNSTAIAIQIGKPPSPNFAWTPSSPMAGDIVTFTAFATADTGVSIANYTWDFGELIGVEATNDSTILHAFPTDGNWTVTLTVFDSDALHSSYSQNVEVTAGEVEQKPPDYTLYIVVSVVVALVAVTLVVRKIRAKKEEALDI